ncbi:hypothetical protein F4801DRAFT_551610 [Xylaria longipes]|nr:hypothetical protein F4801DRAFT_551610 [Xylaria longipes]
MLITLSPCMPLSTTPVSSFFFLLRLLLAINARATPVDVVVQDAARAYSYSFAAPDGAVALKELYFGRLFSATFPASIFVVHPDTHDRLKLWSEGGETFSGEPCVTGHLTNHGLGRLRCGVLSSEFLVLILWLMCKYA